MIRTVAFFLLTPALALADFAEEFQKTRGTKDHAAMVKLLDAAAKTEAENPDYYALASNYWWSFAGEINLSTKPAAEGEPSIRDKDSGEEVGSISTNGDVDPSLRKKAVELTGTGLSKFPKRLDIGLGHAHVRFKTGDAKGAVATLRQLLKLAATPGTEFPWTGNAALPGPVGEVRRQISRTARRRPPPRRLGRCEGRQGRVLPLPQARRRKGTGRHARPEQPRRRPPRPRQEGGGDRGV